MEVILLFIAFGIMRNINTPEVYLLMRNMMVRIKVVYAMVVGSTGKFSKRI